MTKTMLTLRVNGERHTVFAMVIVQFNGVGSGLDCQFERWQCVLRRQGAVAAMADDERTFAREKVEC